MDYISGNHYTGDYAFVSCRMNTGGVGHFSLSFRTKNRGRAAVPQHLKFFDRNGDIKSFTMSPGIHSVEPAIGSSVGGTLVTIRGTGLYRSGEETEVFVGDDICDIISAEKSAVICRTRMKSDTTGMYLGGAGGRTYFFDRHYTENDPAIFRNRPNGNAENTRFWTSGRYRWGYQHTGMKSITRHRRRFFDCHFYCTG